MQLFRILLSTVLLALSHSAVGLATHSLIETAELEQRPVLVGERLTYSVKVAGLSAGKQVTQVVGEMTLDGQSVYHVTSERQSGSMFGKMYHFRDWVESYMMTECLYPLKHVKEIEDRSYKARVEVSFDHFAGQAQYTKNDRRHPIEVPVGIQDELSMLYFLRSKELKVGQTYSFPVLIRDKAENVKLEVYRRQVLKTEALGRVETIALRTSHGYLMWLTNDNRRVPVRIEAELPIGKLVGTLEKLEFVKSSTPIPDNKEIGN